MKKIYPITFLHKQVPQAWMAPHAHPCAVWCGGGENYRFAGDGVGKKGEFVKSVGFLAKAGWFWFYFCDGLKPIAIQCRHN